MRAPSPHLRDGGLADQNRVQAIGLEQRVVKRDTGLAEHALHRSKLERGPAVRPVRVWGQNQTRMCSVTCSTT